MSALRNCMWCGDSKFLFEEFGYTVVEQEPSETLTVTCPYCGTKATYKRPTPAATLTLPTRWKENPSGDLPC
jgi:DNA-directed RNA polymerase subunit RPC12/RpoP